jgi:hypothetical protein
MHRRRAVDKDGKRQLGSDHGQDLGGGHRGIAAAMSALIVK